MKKILTFNFPIILLFALLFLIVSCSDDEPDIVIDPGQEGINVADGFYLASDGEDPSSLAQLTAEVVGASGFGTQDRDGFIAGTMWLDVGSYSLVQVTNKEITSTIGGSAASIDDEGSSCGFNSYDLVSVSEGGSAFSIGTAGLYQVSYDPMTSELIPVQIAQASIIGDATEGGWSSDTDLPGSINSDGGQFSATEVLLRSGLYKIRFNCRWGVNRLIDPDGGLDASNGYDRFTNFGGTPNSLVSGGENMEITEDGLYTVSLDWAPRDGWSFSLNKTGDAPVVAFNPDDFNFGVIGDATAGGWDADRNMVYKGGDNGLHAWYGVVTFAESGQYKFRANDGWDFNLGGSLESLAQGGDNLTPPGPGAFALVLSTADEGDTWVSTISEFGWSVIGAGSPSGDWENDTDLVAEGFADGITTYSVEGAFTGDGWKFRAGHDWNYNLGGDLGALSVDGDNIGMGGSKVTLTYDGENYTAVVE